MQDYYLDAKPEVQPLTGFGFYEVLFDVSADHLGIVVLNLSKHQV
jgi:hypothetical protein